MATKSTTRKSAGRGTRKTKPAAKKKAAASKKKTASKSAKKPAAASRKQAASKRSSSPKKTAGKASRTSRTTKGRSARRKTPKPVRARDVEVKFKHLGESLMRKQAELMQAYASAKNDTRDRLDDGTEDYIDYAVNSYAKDFMLSLTEMERQQLQLVREAIHRLNRGEYGECLQCGVEIPIKRLEVSPWVRYCIQCQELEDQGLLTEPSYPGLDDEETVDEEVLGDESDDDADDESDGDESDDDDESDGDDGDDDLSIDDDEE